MTIARSLTIRPQFAIECLRRSNKQEVGHFGTKFGEERVNRLSQNLTRSRRDMELSYAREVVQTTSSV